MYKKTFTIVLPELATNPTEKYYFFNPDSQISNTICYSSTSLSQELIHKYLNNALGNNVDLNQFKNIEQYRVDKVFEPSSYTFVKYHQDKLTKQYIRNSNIYLFGDEYQIKQLLLSNKISKNSLMKELIHSIFKHTEKIFISFQVFNKDGESNASISKLKVSTYSEYLKLYQSFKTPEINNSSQTSNLLIRLEYCIDGIMTTTQVIKLQGQLQSNTNQFNQIIQCKKSNPIVSKLDAHQRNNIFYYCIEPKNKANKKNIEFLWKQFNQYHGYSNVNTEMTDQSSQLSQYNKNSRTTEQSKNNFSSSSKQKSRKSVQNNAKISEKEQKSTMSKGIPISSINSKFMLENAKEEILNQIQNKMTMKMESKNSMVEMVLQEKNKTISRIEQNLNQKQLELHKTKEQLRQLKTDYQILQNSTKNLEDQYQLVIEENEALKLQICKHKENEAKMLNYQTQVQNVHSDIQITLQKMTNKNQWYKEQIVRIKEQSERLYNQQLEKFRESFNGELMKISELSKQEIGKLNQKLVSQTNNFKAEQLNLKEQIKKLKEEISQLKKRQIHITKKFENAIIEHDQKSTEKIKKITADFNKQKYMYESEMHQLTEKILEVTKKNQQMIPQTNKLITDLKMANQEIMKYQLKYNQICMKLKGIAQIKGSEYNTFASIIDKL